MGIDFGTKRMGLAISDESYTLAREYGILSPKEFWHKLPELIENEGVERIIIGLPLNMSGDHTDKTREVQAFSDLLQQRVAIPVEFMDERLSSVMAGHLPGGKKNVDSLAAQIILQNYLDKTKN
ncbi:MAG: Holliday junction resolvase RuvX [bacterium]|nr:Holliday junction resolvase RuvX [bacterium]